MTHDQSYPASDTAAFQNTDEADAVMVLAAVRHCANSWDGSARLLGNVRACDISRVCTLAIETLSQPASAAQTEPHHQAIEACAALVENFPESILQFVERPGGPPGNRLRSVTRKDLAAAIRSLSNIPSCDDGSKAFPVSSETSVPASPPGGSGAENPTASSASSTHEPAQPASEPRAWTVLHKSGATIWKLLEDKLSADYWRTQGFPVEALYADSPVLEQLRSILANRVDPDWKVLTAARHALALSSTSGGTAA